MFPRTNVPLDARPGSPTCWPAGYDTTPAEALGGETQVTRIEESPGMPIESVSDTARWMAFYRAMETEGPS
ncbi:MAG: hypothetical protein ABI877_23055 [Gemmatimonadaceae bacterium]